MDDHRPESSVDRKEFLRRSGALGIAGAAALGFPLVETRAAGALPLAPPRDVIAAGGGATIKIGHVDSFSGVYAAASASQQHGMEVAVAQAMRKNNRIKYELLRGDDTSKPAVGETEAKRLIQQDKADVIAGCLSSAVGLAVSATCEQNNTFFLAIGTHDTNITGPKAHRVTFRQTCSNAMLANAVGPELLKNGRKKWYFLVADYAFGTDARDRLKKILLANGGTVVGEDLHALGATDYSSYLTKVRNSNADVLVYCNYGPDTQNAVKEAVQLGLHKKMLFGGILCGNDVAVGMPVDDCVGSLWGYVWGPEAGGGAMSVYDALKAGVTEVDWRQYLGYMAALNIINRLNAAGTTDTEKLVEAFENYHYDAAKKSGAYFRKCDHQAIQQTYAGMIVAKNKRRNANEYFTIASTVGGEFAAEACGNPDSTAAQKIITSEKIAPRENYTAVSLR